MYICNFFSVQFCKRTSNEQHISEENLNSGKAIMVNVNHHHEGKGGPGEYQQQQMHVGGSSGNNGNARIIGHVESSNRKVIG